MFPLSCRLVDVSRSNSSRRLPSSTTTRVSSACVLSISMRLVIKGRTPVRRGRARAGRVERGPATGTAENGDGGGRAAVIERYARCDRSREQRTGDGGWHKYPWQMGSVPRREASGRRPGEANEPRRANSRGAGVVLSSARDHSSRPSGNMHHGSLRKMAQKVV